ncbi:hypothetical protein NQ315_011847 [Exocentrus adspersus]|uniref:Sugar transporter SWEET1 n=1 Tax=Exocentrus adspersus TaxID=1586481 RepID=A0AAV8W2N0_9CUCU|nr:hypothetical protein NQ315_011847 [Exocentrus adspersus]
MYPNLFSVTEPPAQNLKNIRVREPTAENPQNTNFKTAQAYTWAIDKMLQALSDTLQPYKAIVGQVASIVTIGQFFSGAFICRDIYRRGDPGEVPATPFVGGIIIGSLMLQHGLLLNDPAMLQVNVFAILLNVLYTIFYYWYARDKYGDVLKPFAIGALILAVVLGYAQVEDPEVLPYRYGLLVTVLMLALLASPLLNVKEIIAKKDASSIPFALTFMGTIVTFLWLVYGIILMNEFMIFQNVVGFSLCLIQLVLILKYPGPDVEVDKMLQALSSILLPYKTLIGQSASIVSMGHFFSGVFVCRNIYRMGSTGQIPVTPFLGGIVISILMLIQGLLLKDRAMLQTNIFAIVLNVGYMSFYYLYAKDKYRDVLKPLGIAALIIGAVVGYTQVEDPEVLPNRYGMLLFLTMLTLIGSPLFNLRKIIETKDASSIPFTLPFMGFAMTLLSGVCTPSY